MFFVRLLTQALLALLFSAFGTVAVFAAPGDWTRISYPVVAQELSALPVNLTNTARAPPTIGANLTSTGTALAQSGELRASDGAETAGAVYALLRSSIAPNRLPVPDRRVEITELFDNTNPRSGIQIGNRTVLNDPTNTGGARVFSDVSDVEVRNYFTELTGQPLPAPRTVNIGGRDVQLYTVRTPDGNFNLRSGSSSVLPNGQTPSWTIDVPGGATGRVDSRGRPVTSELKFE
jgi:hypothetical protein